MHLRISRAANMQSDKAQARLNAINDATDARNAEMDADMAEAIRDAALAKDLRKQSVARRGRKREREMDHVFANLESAEIVFKEQCKEPASYSVEARDAQDALVRFARNELNKLVKQRIFEESTES